MIAENAKRRALILTNDSDAVIYLGIGSNAVMNKGLRVEASGGKLVFGGGDPGGGQNTLPITTQAINGISAAGGKVMLVQEAT